MFGGKRICVEKLWCILVIFAGILITLLSGSSAMAYSDKTAPRITEVSLSKNTVKAGESIDIQFMVEEEDTGIKGIGVSLQGKESGSMVDVINFAGIWFDDQPLYTGEYTAQNLQVDKESYSGEYFISSVSVYDDAGNFRRYEYAGDGKMVDADNGNEVCVIKGLDKLTVTDGREHFKEGTTLLKSIEFKNPEVSYDGYLNVEMITENEIHIQNGMQVSFYNQYGEFIHLYSKDMQISGNKITYRFPMFQIDDITNKPVYLNVSSGEYFLDIVQYGCENGEYVMYRRQDDGAFVYQGHSVTDPVDCSDPTINYKSHQLYTDTTPPQIRDIRLMSSTEISKPSVIVLEVDIWDDADITYVGTDADSKSECIRTIKAEDGTMYTYQIKIMLSTSASQEERFVYPYIVVISGENFTQYDYNGEDGYYYIRDYTVPALYWTYYAVNEKLLAVPQIKIKEEFDVVIDSTLNDSRLVQKIKGMQSGQTARIRLRSSKGGRYLAKKELFEAIRGRDINLLFDMDSDTNYQWIINGRDVSKPKDISLEVYFSVMSGYEYGTTDSVLQLTFANNGELPGKMSFRFKSGYVKSVLNLASDIYLYYDNQKSGKLELEKKANAQYVVDDSDAWLYFDLTHNSTFLASKTKLGKPMIVSKKYQGIYKKVKKNEVTYIAPYKVSVKSVTIPKTITYSGKKYKVTSIANNAFSGCKKLKTVTLGSNIKKIGARAFYNCKALTQITIPEKVTKIGNDAFRDCAKLKTIKIKSTKLTSNNVGNNAFKGIYSKVKVSVPKTKYKKYKKILKERGLTKKAKIRY